MALSEWRWTTVSPSRHGHEQEGLDFLRSRLPDEEPFRVWSNFVLTAEDGRQHEVDALVATPSGLVLVELKHWVGTVTGDEAEWVQQRPDGSFTRHRREVEQSDLTVPHGSPHRTCR